MAFVKRVGRVARLFFQSKNNTIVEVHGKKSRGLDIFQECSRAIYLDRRAPSLNQILFYPIFQ